MDEDSLVVLLDTHRAVLAESPGLVDMCEHLVIIDHHRRSEDAIDNATLAYMEPYASSTSESSYRDASVCRSQKPYQNLRQRRCLAA